MGYAVYVVGVVAMLVGIGVGYLLGRWPTETEVAEMERVADTLDEHFDEGLVTSLTDTLHQRMDSRFYETVNWYELAQQSSTTAPLIKEFEEVFVNTRRLAAEAFEMGMDDAESEAKKLMRLDQLAESYPSLRQAFQE